MNKCLYILEIPGLKTSEVVLENYLIYKKNCHTLKIQTVLVSTNEEMK